MGGGKPGKPQRAVCLDKQGLSTPMGRYPGTGSRHQSGKRLVVAPQLCPAVQGRPTKCHRLSNFHMCSRATFIGRSQTPIAFNECLRWFSRKVNRLQRKAV